MYPLNDTQSNPHPAQGRVLNPVWLNAGDGGLEWLGGNGATVEQLKQICRLNFCTSSLELLVISLSFCMILAFDCVRLNYDFCTVPARK